MTCAASHLREQTMKPISSRQCPKRDFFRFIQRAASSLDGSRPLAPPALSRGDGRGFAAAARGRGTPPGGSGEAPPTPLAPRSREGPARSARSRLGPLTVPFPRGASRRHVRVRDDSAQRAARRRGRPRRARHPRRRGAQAPVEPREGARVERRETRSCFARRRCARAMTRRFSAPRSATAPRRFARWATPGRADAASCADSRASRS